MDNLGVCIYEGHDVNGVVLTFFCLRDGDNLKAKQIVRDRKKDRDLSAYYIVSKAESLALLQACGYLGNINKVYSDYLINRGKDENTTRVFNR